MAECLLKEPHAVQESQHTYFFGSVTCCCVVYVYTHYYWVFCMVKGLQAGRSVDSQKSFEVGLVKSIGPSGQVRLGD